MATYTKKRILIMLTGGTIAGNVAANNVAENIKSDPTNFSSVVDSCIEILKKTGQLK